ncbi:restriction endonuclease subunit S [Cupriavidus campinensis]
MSLPKYPQYKDSGVSWLGQVPAHWAISQTKRYFRRKKELNVGMACENRLALTMNGVVPRSLDDLDGLQSSDYEGYQIFEAGDLAFKLIDLQNIKTSRVGLVPERGIMSPAYIRLEPQATDTRFAYWYFMALYWTQVFNALGGGVRQTLGPEELLTVEFPVPSHAEQTAIAIFLDRETGKIDALIAEQERLLTLLAEKRQTTISHAVTRGLNPNAPMKDSGVPWLGELPATWGVTRLKFVASVQTGIAKGKDTTGKETVSVPYLRVANVQDGFLALDDIAMIDIEPEQLERYRLLSGDVLMNEGGDFDKLGRGAIWHGEIQDCIHQNHVFAVRPHSVEARWLNQITSSQYAQFYFMGRSKQSTNLASISSSNIMELPVLMPPAQEQGDILVFIDAETTKLDALRADVEHAVALLKARRSALIAAAVTGKIDVRDAMPQELAA